MKVEIHELKVNQKIVLIDLEGKNENVNLKLGEDFYQVDMMGVREYTGPSLIVVAACIDANQYIEVDLKTLVLATIVTPNGVTTAMIDFRALDGHLPGLWLLPMDNSAEEVFGLISSHRFLLDYQDIFLFKKLSAIMGAY